MFMTEQTEHSEQTVLVKCKKLSPLRPSHVPNTGEVKWTVCVDTTQAETMKMGLVEDRSRVFAEFCSTEVQWRSCEQNSCPEFVA